VNVHLSAGSYGSFRCAAKMKTRGWAGLRQIKRLPVILKLSAYRKLLTLKIRGLLKGSKRETAVSAVFFIIRLHRLRAAFLFIG
jgi:hypothetical protein